MTVQPTLPIPGAATKFTPPARPALSDPRQRLDAASQAILRVNAGAPAGKRPIGALAAAVLHYLCVTADATGSATFNARVLAPALAMHRNSLNAALKALAQNGLASVQRESHRIVVECLPIGVPTGGPAGGNGTGDVPTGGPAGGIGTGGVPTAGPAGGNGTGGVPTGGPAGGVGTGGVPTLAQQLGHDSRRVREERSRARINAFPQGRILHDQHGNVLPPAVAAEVAAIYRAKLHERVTDTANDERPVSFEHDSGTHAYWRVWIKRPSYPRNWPRSPALERLRSPIPASQPRQDSTTRKCRKCSTTRWRTLSSDGLCERCEQQPGAERRRAGG